MLAAMSAAQSLPVMKDRSSWPSRRAIARSSNARAMAVPTRAAQLSSSSAAMSKCSRTWRIPMVTAPEAGTSVPTSPYPR